MANNQSEKIYLENEKEFIDYVVRVELGLNKNHAIVANILLLDKHKNKKIVNLATLILNQEIIDKTGTEVNSIEVQKSTLKKIKRKIAEKKWHLKDGRMIENWHDLRTYLRYEHFQMWLKSKLDREVELSLTLNELWSILTDRISASNNFIVRPRKEQIASIHYNRREKKTLPKYSSGTRVNCYLKLEQPSYVILLCKESSGLILCVCPSYLVFKNYHPPGEFICPDLNHEECPYLTLENEAGIGIEEWIAITSPQKLALNWVPDKDEELEEHNPIELSEVELLDLLNSIKNQECQVMGFKYQITAQ